MTRGIQARLTIMRRCYENIRQIEISLRGHWSEGHKSNLKNSLKYHKEELKKYKKEVQKMADEIKTNKKGGIK